MLRILIFHCLPTRGHSATSLQRTQPADPSKQAIFKLHCLILVLTHKYLHIINVTEIWLYFGITLKNVILLWNFHSHFGLNCDVVGFFLMIFHYFVIFCSQIIIITVSYLPVIANYIFIATIEMYQIIKQMETTTLS